MGTFQMLVSNGQLGLIVHQVYYAEMIMGGLGNEYTPQDPASIFCVVDLGLRNTSGSTRVSVNPAKVVIRDADGTKYWPNIQLLLGPPPELADRLALADLGAGDEERGALLFVVPDRDTPSRQVVYTGTSPQVAVEIRGQGIRKPGPGNVVGPITNAGLELNVVNWHMAEKVSSGSWTTKAPEGSMLVVVTVRMRNIDRTPSFTVNKLNCVLTDTQGNNYRPGMVTLGLANQLELTELAPGYSVEGAVLFTIPSNTNPSFFWYKTGALGGPLGVHIGPM